MIYFIQVLYIITLIALDLVSYGPRGQIEVGLNFTLILLLLFLSYLFLFWKAEKLSFKNIAILLGITVVVSFFANPATFSNDIFNYVFDGKIPLVYGKSPWVFAPQSFPDDPWLKFANWPTSTTRYGAVWVGISFAANLLGRQNLLLTEFILKFFLVVLGYMLIMVIITKLAQFLKIPIKKALIFFGINTLIIVEFLINPHTDVLITSLSLLAIYFFLKKKILVSAVLLILACFIKITVLPLWGVYFLHLIFKSLSKEQFLICFLLTAYFGAAVITLRWSINPWYFSLPFAISSLLFKKTLVRYLMISLTAALLVRYLPYMFIGYFDPTNKIRLLLFLIFMTPFCVWTIYKLRRIYFGKLS